MKKLWYLPKTHSGWRKTQSTEERRRKLMASTDKRLSLHDRYVQAGRKIQSLANVTKDKPTGSKARMDAMYFFRRAEKKK